MLLTSLHSSAASFNLYSSTTLFASSNLSPSSSSQRHNVSFSDVEIVVFPVTVGDASVGVPITVDWEAQACNVFPLELFEKILRIKPETREKAVLEDETLAGVLKSKTLLQERIATMNQLRVLSLLDLQYEREEEGGRKPRAEVVDQ